jgi:hypothetical protein
MTRRATLLRRLLGSTGGTPSPKACVTASGGAAVSAVILLNLTRNGLDTPIAPPLPSMPVPAAPEGQDIAKRIRG